MNTLWIACGVMLLGALSFLAVSLRITGSALLSRPFLCASSFILGVSILLYTMTTSFADLRFWLTQGQQHYVLQVQLEKLGGIEGVIAQVKAKLDRNPQDSQGWLILGKLYLAHQRYADAKQAFNKVLQLDPNNSAATQLIATLPS